MRTTLYLPDPLAVGGREYAAAHGTTITALVIQYLEAVTGIANGDPMVMFSRGQMTKQGAIDAAGFRDYAELLVAMGDADLPLPALPEADIKRQAGVVAEIMGADGELGDSNVVRLARTAEESKMQRQFSEMIDRFGNLPPGRSPVPLIIKDPDILGGAPVFGGTRVPVAAIFEYLVESESLKEILLAYPDVTNEMAVQAMRKALDRLADTATTKRPSEALAAHRKEVLAILARYPVTNPRIFGSVVRGTDEPGSDLDILVDIDREKGPPFTLITVAQLERELGALLGVPVDIGTDVQDRFREEVLAEARPL